MSLMAQYFFTGEVKDPHGDKLQDGSITVLSTGQTYRTGLHGEFGINSRKQTDTLTLSFDGYEAYTTRVSATAFLQVTLKSLSFHSVSQKVENGFVDQSASVSFPATINQGSYPLIGKFLDMGFPVPGDAVQIEAMLNYFNSYYEDPDREDAFRCASSLAPCPWNKEHKLLCLNICARKVNIGDKPPGNLVFLIDASGSMDLPNKLPVVKSGFRLLVKNLRDIDTVSVIAFGGRVRPLLVGIPGSEKARIIRTIETLVPDGPTPGEEALRLAYLVARRQFIPGGNNRIILVTDGDIGEGSANPGELEDLIEQQSRDSIYLTCIGVGMGSYQHPGLPMLAQAGHGSFSYINNERDLEKLLVGQLAENLVTVADNVSISTDFNPAYVQSYRLIGFDSKRKAARRVMSMGGKGDSGAGDIRDTAGGAGAIRDTAENAAGIRDSLGGAGAIRDVTGGTVEIRDTTGGLGDSLSEEAVSSISSGHSVLALFELVPREKVKDTGAVAKRDSAVVAGQGMAVVIDSVNIAAVKIRYRLPGQVKEATISYNCPNELVPFNKAGSSLRKAAIIALFGMKLRESGCVSQISWGDIEKMAKQNFAATDFVDREYMESIVKARKVYRHNKEGNE